MLCVPVAGLFTPVDYMSKATKTLPVKNVCDGFLNIGGMVRSDATTLVELVHGDNIVCGTIYCMQ